MILLVLFYTQLDASISLKYWTTFLQSTYFGLDFIGHGTVNGVGRIFDEVTRRRHQDEVGRLMMLAYLKSHQNILYKVLSLHETIYTMTPNKIYKF